MSKDFSDNINTEIPQSDDEKKVPRPPIQKPMENIKTLS